MMNVKRIYLKNQEQLPEEFYNEKQEINVLQREEKTLYNHRVFNNWVKSVLINETFQKFRRENKELDMSVMDLGCGKGGDLKKLFHVGTRNYVGVDIAIQGLRDALLRKIQDKKFYFPCLFVRNSGSELPEKFFNKIPKEMYFDVISAQFCMHYFFESQESVRNFLQNISLKLVNGGYFISTFADYEVILGKIQRSLQKNDSTICWENQHCSILFDRQDLYSKEPFGIKYGFFLDDDLVGRKRRKADGISIIYVPEYLVLLDNFLQIAKEFGLELDETLNFHRFYEEKLKDQENMRLFQKIGFKQQGEDLMSDEEWECSFLYRTLRLKKVTGIRPEEVNRNYKDPFYFKLIE